MKKILLGLLAVSAIAMGATSSLDGPGSIEIETKAFIVSSGLIITDSSNEDKGIDKIELNHMYVLETDKTEKTQTKDIYIKKINGTGFFGGSEIEVTLASLETANLKNTKANKEIPHTLSAVLISTSGVTLKNSGDITIAGTTTTSTNTVAIENGNNTITAIPFQIKSNFTLPSENIAEGEYNNTATLTVKYSKVLGNVQQTSEAR